MKSSSKHSVMGILFFIIGIGISLIWLGVMVSTEHTHWIWDYPIAEVISMVTFGMIGIGILLFCLNPLGLEIKRIKITSN